MSQDVPIQMPIIHVYKMSAVNVLVKPTVR
jgi:hypothetical protein